jgi:septum formation protein
VPIKQNKLATAPTYHLILASTSPRRRQFLDILGLPFSAVSPGFAAANGEVDETPLSGETPVALVQRLSRLKAQAVADNLALLLPSIAVSQPSQVVIIAADTVVVLDHQILGKPQTPLEATQMLQALRGRAHGVYSGLTVAYPSAPSPQAPDETMHFSTRLQQSTVWMRPYSDAEIAAYVATGSPLDKAGAYGIQDQPFAPVERLEGCFASVMGLPLAELAQLLAEIGVPLPDIGPLCSHHTGIPCCQLPKGDQS